MTPQQLFILDELWILAWAASVQRTKLFADHAQNSKELRFKIKQFVSENLLNQYVHKCSEARHLKNIATLVEFGSAASPACLRDGSYRYGVAQKLLNLLLKYHWCAGHIEEPPHCPVDRVIIGKTSLRNKVNWTQIRTEEQYSEVIDAIRVVAGRDGLAVWELNVYSRP